LKLILITFSIFFLNSGLFFNKSFAAHHEEKTDRPMDEADCKDEECVKKPSCDENPELCDESQKDPKSEDEKTTDICDQQPGLCD